VIIFLAPDTLVANSSRVILQLVLIDTAVKCEGREKVRFKIDRQKPKKVANKKPIQFGVHIFGAKEKTVSFDLKEDNYTYSVSDNKFLAFSFTS
jgi:hypothetical protein